jgi:hypothetical protein
MKLFSFLLFVALLSLTGIIYGQDEDLQVGSNTQYRQSQGAFFDYSDPETVNIRVAVWGYVRYPGRYIIPDYSTMNDLISFAGGPTDDAHLDDLRIYRTEPDSTVKLYKFDYNDLLWTDEITTLSRTPEVKPGDILLVPGEPRLYFMDWFTMTLALVSTLISLSILILNIAE